MRTINMPKRFVQSALTMTQQTTQRVAASNFSGIGQAVDLLNDRWLCSMTLPLHYNDNMAEIEAFIASMRGQTNVVLLWHMMRPEPQGTVRGNLYLQSAALQGADTLVVAGCSPADGTLLVGDLLGIGQTIYMVAEDCQAVAGVITVQLSNRVRRDFPINSQVTWHRPSAKFRITNTSGVTYEPKVTQPVTFEFEEAITSSVTNVIVNYITGTLATDQSQQTIGTAVLS